MTVIAAEIHNVNIPNCIPNPNNNLFPGSPANNIEIDIICKVVLTFARLYTGKET